MIRLSKLTDYGIVLLTHLAMGDDRSLQTAQDLARRSRVPLPTASKLLKSLARAGLVTSHRGRRGGYGLARDAERISVAEVISAIEGPIGLTECGTGGCDLEATCAARGRWGAISLAVERALSEVPLSSMRPQPEAVIRLGRPTGVTT